MERRANVNPIYRKKVSKKAFMDAGRWGDALQYLELGSTIKLKKNPLYLSKS